MNELKILILVGQLGICPLFFSILPSLDVLKFTITYTPRTEVHVWNKLFQISASSDISWCFYYYFCHQYWHHCWLRHMRCCGLSCCDCVSLLLLAATATVLWQPASLIPPPQASIILPCGTQHCHKPWWVFFFAFPFHRLLWLGVTGSFASLKSGSLHLRHFKIFLYRFP